MSIRKKNIKEYFLNVDNTKIAVYEQGQGEAVLFLHGYTGSHLTWEKECQKLAGHFRVISVDWFGWGNSEKNPNLDYSFSEEIKRLKRLAQALRLNSFHLVGHDYGGLLALGFALAYKDSLKSLILSNTRAHQTFRPFWYLAFWFLHMLAVIPWSGFWYKIFPLKWTHAQAIKKEVQSGIIPPIAALSYYGWMDSSAGKKFLAKYFKDYGLKPKKELNLGLAKIKIPTLVLWGEQDKYLSPQIAKELGKFMPNCSVKFFPDAGHFLPEQKPEEVSACIMKFLLKNSQNPPYGQTK